MSALEKVQKKKRETEVGAEEKEEFDRENKTGQLENGPVTWRSISLPLSCACSRISSTGECTLIRYSATGEREREIQCKQAAFPKADRTALKSKSRATSPSAAAAARLLSSPSRRPFPRQSEGEPTVVVVVVSTVGVVSRMVRNSEDSRDLVSISTTSILFHQVHNP